MAAEYVSIHEQRRMIVRRCSTLEKHFTEAAIKYFLQEYEKEELHAQRLLKILTTEKEKIERLFTSLEPQLELLNEFQGYMEERSTPSSTAIVDDRIQECWGQLHAMREKICSKGKGTEAGRTAVEMYVELGNAFTFFKEFSASEEIWCYSLKDPER